MKLEAKHVAIIAGIIGGVAIQLSSAKSWGDAFTPAFVSGLLMQVVSGVTAIFVGAPGAAQDLAHANLRADLAQERAADAMAKPSDVNVTINNPVEKK